MDAEDSVSGTAVAGAQRKRCNADMSRSGDGDDGGGGGGGGGAAAQCASDNDSDLDTEQSGQLDAEGALQSFRGVASKDLTAAWLKDDGFRHPIYVTDR
jgi:hypothetical protein